MKKSIAFSTLLMLGLSELCSISYASEYNTFETSKEEKTYPIKSPKVLLSKSEKNDATLVINDTFSNNPCNNSIKAIPISLVQTLYEQFNNALKKEKNYLLPDNITHNYFDVFPVKLYFTADGHDTVTINDLKNTTMGDLFKKYNWLDSAAILISVTIKKNENFKEEIRVNTFDEEKEDIKVVEKKSNSVIKILTKEELKQKKENDENILEKKLRTLIPELDEHYDYDVSISGHARDLLNNYSIEKILHCIDQVKKNFMDKNKNALDFVKARSLFKEKFELTMKDNEFKEINFNRLNWHLKRLLEKEKKSADYIIDNSDEIISNIIQYEQKIQKPYQDIQDFCNVINEAENNNKMDEILTEEFLNNLKKSIIKLKQFWSNNTVHNAIYHPNWAFDMERLDETRGQPEVTDILCTLRKMNSTTMNIFVNDCIPKVR